MGVHIDFCSKIPFSTVFYTQSIFQQKITKSGHIDMFDQRLLELILSSSWLDRPVKKTPELYLLYQCLT